MNTQKLTKKSIEAINTAQSEAIERSNTQVDEEHLLYALLSAQDSLISSLFS